MSFAASYRSRQSSTSLSLSVCPAVGLQQFANKDGDKAAIYGNKHHCKDSMSTNKVV